MTTPTIIAAFSNPTGVVARNSLEAVDTENRELEKMFIEEQAKERLTYLPVVNLNDAARIKSLFQLFQKNIRVFHYAGHANTLRLDLQGSPFAVDSFAENIKNCTRLKLVFLNGCSTKGFVRSIFERTARIGSAIQAVIATSFPVGDAAAQQFATTFFRLFVQGGYNLENAFRTAIIDYSGSYTTTDENVFRVDIQAGTIAGISMLMPAPAPGQTRAAVSETQLLEEAEGGEEEVPWGLYITTETVLDWKLYDQEADPGDEIARLKPMLEAERIRNEVFNENIDKLSKKIDKLAALGDPEFMDILDDFRLQKREEEERWQKSNQEIQRLEEQLGDLKVEKEDDEIIRIFTEKFYELNYKEQDAFVDNLKKTRMDPKAAGLILHGTMDCAVNLLSFRVKDSLKMAETSVVRFDYKSSVLCPVWQQVKMSLSLNADWTSPQKIVEEICRQYRGKDGQTQRGFIFLFRNPAQTPDFKEYTKKALEFWDLFLQLFQQKDQAASFDHRICLFILDENCRRDEAGACQYTSDRYADYEQLIQTTGDCASTVAILPVVYPLTEDSITTWQSNRSFTQKLLLKEDEKDRLIGETKGRFMPAIRELSGIRINNAGKKEQAYLDFRRMYIDSSL